MAEESVVNRYDRQERIQGWSQEKLTSSRIAVIGSDIMANYAALSAAALGFGGISILGQGVITRELLAQHSDDGRTPDFSEGFLYFDAHPGNYKAEAIAEFCVKLNPYIAMRGLNINVSRPGNEILIGDPEVIIDVTNDPFSKALVLEYGSKHRIPVVSAAADAYGGCIGVYQPGQRRPDRQKLLENLVFAEFQHQAQGPTPSQVMSALAVDEARKIVMPLRNEQVLQDLVIYTLQSDGRFNRDMGSELPQNEHYSERHVMMVGAGALGNFAGLSFVLNGLRHLKIADYDTVEDTNLNRQVLFYDAVGQNKAHALAKKLQQINPRVDITASRVKIDPSHERTFREGGMDMIIDTVDNNKTRALLNYFSLKYQIPFISGGTRYDSGQVTISVPRKTACLNCQADIDNLARAGHQPTSCIYAPEASVITTNQVIGALIEGEARSILLGREPVQGVLKYVLNEELRLGMLPTQQPCTCSTNEALLGRWRSDMAFLFEGDGR